jgi:hypothetical protein
MSSGPLDKHKSIDQDARALEHQSRYVTTAGRGHHAISALWSVWPLSGMIAKVPQNSGFCTSGQDRGGGERIGSALADSVSAWPVCEVGIRVVLGRRRPVYVGGFG